MKKTHTIITIAVVGVVCFFGGMKYGQSTSKPTTGTSQTNFQSGAGGGGRRGFAAGQGATAGEILSLDATGITLKMRDGSSKIIILSSSTPVMKTATGSMSDLKTGEAVVVESSSTTFFVRRMEKK